MENFSLLVRKKYEALNSDEKLMFNEEYKRRKKPFESLLDNDLALSILRDISMIFGNPPIEDNSEKRGFENFNNKASGNAINLPLYKKPNRNYLFYLFCVLFFGIVGLSAYMKPTKVEMQNDIINKFLETQPQFIKFFKNVFLGEEITEEKADNLMYNLFEKSGYKIHLKDYDLVFVKKMEIVEEISDKTLLVAYGIFGETFITYKADDLVIDIYKNKSLNSNNSTSKPIENIDYSEYKIINSEANYKNAPNDYEKAVNKEKSESKSSNLHRNKGVLDEIKNQSKEDSIKI